MNLRCCVFVDGENLRHSICDLFERDGLFRREEYLPRADWLAFFEYVAERAKPGYSDAHMFRAYWYCNEHIDFHPHKLPQGQSELAALFTRGDPEFRRRASQLAATETESLHRLVDQWKGKVVKRRERMRKRFSGWRHVQDSIAQRYERIEFRRAGSIKYNCYDSKLGSEKAVDVKLATDMLVLADTYDMAVVVSGDQDYSPAVQVVKDRGKRVVNVCFEKSDGELLPGGSWRLNLITDTYHAVPYDEMARHMALGAHQP